MHLHLFQNYKKLNLNNFLDYNLKTNSFFLIRNNIFIKKPTYNEKILSFRLNSVVKTRLLLSIKKIVFLNVIKNFSFLVFLKNLNFLINSFQISSLINFNNKVYLLKCFRKLNSLNYLQNKKLLFKHFSLLIKKTFRIM